MLEDIIHLSQFGIDDVTIAMKLGVSVETIKRHREKMWIQIPQDAKDPKPFEANEANHSNIPRRFVPENKKTNVVDVTES